MASILLFANLAALVVGQSSITYSQTGPASNTITAGAASLAPVSSYSYTFTVTTPTTVWHAPTFATASPVPVCSDTMCPAVDGKYCVDSLGDTYGVLCDTRFSGTVITNSGKMLMARNPDQPQGIDKRAYSGTFDNCAGFCDEYDDPSAPCTGISFRSGYCQSFDTITGTFPQPGGIAAVRQT